MSKSRFSLVTPRGRIVQNGKGNAQLVWNPGFGPQMNAMFDSVQTYVDSEVIRRCEPFVPLDTGMLKKSAILLTVLGSGQVIYATPYARKWYFKPARFQGAPFRGNFWFERMKNEGGKEAILRGAQIIAARKRG